MSKEILTPEEKVYKIENMILDFEKSEDENLTNLAYAIYNFMTESESEEKFNSPYNYPHGETELKLISCPNCKSQNVFMYWSDGIIFICQDCKNEFNY